MKLLRRDRKLNACMRYIFKIPIDMSMLLLIIESSLAYFRIKARIFLQVKCGLNSVILR